MLGRFFVQRRFRAPGLGGIGDLIFLGCCKLKEFSIYVGISPRGLLFESVGYWSCICYED
jgi:hypothetical protein